VEDEIWKIVPSVPDYEASSLGFIRRVPFVGSMPSGGTRVYGGVPTKGTLRKDKMRYFIVYKNKNYAVHRMVCEAFNGLQPHPYPQSVVTHLNEDGMDNRACNLSWRSQKENLNDKKIKEYHCSRTRENNPRIKGDIKKQLTSDSF
jgi:hypothetical protein